MPAGLNNSLGVQLPPLGRCWPREVWLGRISSRVVAGEIAGRPNAGRDYISCHDKRLGCFLVGLVKDSAGECRREDMVRRGSATAPLPFSLNRSGHSHPTLFATPGALGALRGST